jgi:hypothetical protein
MAEAASVAARNWRRCIDPSSRKDHCKLPRADQASSLAFALNAQWLRESRLDFDNFLPCNGFNQQIALRGDRNFSALPPKPAPPFPRDRRLFLPSPIST